jgi:predicted ribosome quality control (RQC) complex YloA/Tae2 family protein
VNDKIIEAVTEEIRPALLGRKFGRVFPLSRRSFAVDLRLSDSRYLFVGAEPRDPRVYLIRRRIKELERAAQNPQPFHLLLKKSLSKTEVTSVDKISRERVVHIRFAGFDETGNSISPSLVIQLTGKSSNVFLLDDRQRIVRSLIEKDSDGQRMGEIYSIPQRPDLLERGSQESFESDGEHESISEALDRMYLERDADERFRSQAESARRALKHRLSKQEKLLSRLRADLEAHGEAEKWKRSGDLILANLATAKRKGSKIVVTDFFEEDTPEIVIEADENISLTDAAQKYFKLYAKAQTAATEVQRRIQTVQCEIASLRTEQADLEQAISERNDKYFTPLPDVDKVKHKITKKPAFAGARRFTSSDGYEILVGKKAADNDHLTFRIASSLDLWLHAADYSGSHVVVRNPNRKEIPRKTLLEAAKLAAFYSSGKSQTKAAVHYTQKKYVHKSKGSSPGLVRLASFKTILVEPSIPEALDQRTHS